MESRKKDHINLAFRSQLSEDFLNRKFFYEPALAAHPEGNLPEVRFLNKKLQLPVWVSSMTGGTMQAKKINLNLANACREFGMGMGLGSCRPLLEDNSRFSDFDMRPIIGNELPLMANFGVAQIEESLAGGNVNKINDLLHLLKVDGLFVHLNPVQEFLQPEGDRFQFAPIETIGRLISKIDFPIMVKEVGQGMGPKSLEALLNLNIAGIEFGAFGGTNFAQLELKRSDQPKQEVFKPLIEIGHTAEEMVSFLNNFPAALMKDKNIIISGGISDWLLGYYLIKKSKHPAIFGQASAFLKYALNDYSDLQTYVSNLKNGLLLANTYLTIRT